MQYISDELQPVCRDGWLFLWFVDLARLGDSLWLLAYPEFTTLLKNFRSITKSFLELPNGIPSHDTFNRLFARLNPEQFQACFMSWVMAVSELIGAQVIAIDGKVLRRSHDKGVGKAAIDMVSAWATANCLVLGQVKVDEKSNEITAIPQLLEALEIAGCIVTIDAMGCQTEIAEKIIERQADYVLALKDNQGNLYEDVVRLFDDLESSQYRAYECDYDQTVNKDHGRIEIRECWTISDPAVWQH